MKCCDENYEYELSCQFFLEIKPAQVGTLAPPCDQEKAPSGGLGVNFYFSNCCNCIFKQGVQS